MVKPYKILVPIDGSKNSMRGLATAISFAKATGAEITGFHVLQLPLMSGIKFTKVMERAIVEKASKVINQGKRLAKQSDVAFKLKTDRGHVGTRIVKFAEKNKYVMIIIGTRGLSGLKEKFLGSTSNYVVHKTKIPVLIVK